MIVDYSDSKLLIKWFQRKDLTCLGRCGDLASELAGDADHLLHQLSVGLCQDTLAQVHIVLETHPYMTAVDDCGSCQRKLVASDTGHRICGVRGYAAAQEYEIPEFSA